MEADRTRLLAAYLDLGYLLPRFDQPPRLCRASLTRLT